MRDYIILNGLSSENITGLLIQELPPITKPKIRTSIEEIDGKDGDTITKLGYSAYDKEIKIGLTYKYDIDEIIDFFNSEGIITFSNEPSKYYRYSIIEQIDFEKLIRFKTAKIKMHIQPFKYALGENKKIFNILDEKEIMIRNNGNIYSKPKVTIKGNGIVNLYLNDIQLFVIDLSNESEITINFEKMNAYNQETLVYKNRLVTGNYDNFNLKVGKNKISWNGIITQIQIENYSRWV